MSKIPINKIIKDHLPHAKESLIALNMCGMQIINIRRTVINAKKNI